MADQMNILLAEKVYKTLCETIDNMNWHYEKVEERMLIHLEVNGDDLPMSFIIFVDAERQLVRVMSSMPFNMSEEKRLDGAIAVCVASFGMVDGNFIYDMSDGSILFKMTASFMDSIISEPLLKYMISCSCATVDAYNDKFFALNKGVISINDFIASENA